MMIVELILQVFRLVSQVSNGNTCPELVTRVYEVADLCGNLSTCSEVIEIDDDNAPLVTAPLNLFDVCSIDEHPPYETWEDFRDAGGDATDNCGLDEDSF